MNKIFTFMILIFLISFSFMLYPQKIVSNQDKPLKGRWGFGMKKLWEVREPGGDIFTHIGQITLDDRETAYVVDRRSYKIHIIDKNGKSISSFGKEAKDPVSSKLCKDASQ